MLSIPNLQLASTRQRALRFFISGCLATGANVTTLYILTDLLGFWYLYGASVAFIVGVSASFMMQKFFTFQDRTADTALVKKQITLFVLVALLNVFLNAGVVYVLVEFAHLYHIIAQIFSAGGIALISFFLYHLIFHPVT